MQEQDGKKGLSWKELGYHFAMEEMSPEVLKRYQSEFPEHSDNLLTLYHVLTEEDANNEHQVP